MEIEDEDYPEYRLGVRYDEYPVSNNFYLLIFLYYPRLNKHDLNIKFQLVSDIIIISNIEVVCNMVFINSKIRSRDKKYRLSCQIILEYIGCAFFSKLESTSSF